jgi:hypothetical protein
MIPDARSVSRFLLSLTLLGIGCSTVFGDDDLAFGFDRTRLDQILAGRDAAPILALTEERLRDTGTFGPSSYYYLARKLEALSAASERGSAVAADPALAAESATKARLLYRLAYESSTGIVRREAGLGLLASLSEAGHWGEILVFSAALEREIGPSREIDSATLEAAAALGIYDRVASIARRAAVAYPDDAAGNPDELAYYSALAALRSGAGSRSDESWRPIFRRLMLDAPASEWSTRAFALLRLEPKLVASFTTEELHAAAMRDAVRRRDYGLAGREARLASSLLLSTSASKAVVADAGKAFLYSGSSKEGEALFSGLEAAAVKVRGGLSSREGVAWTALFYRARFERALERRKQAAELFEQAAAWAPTNADVDSCLWYAAESRYRDAASATHAATPGTEPGGAHASRLGLLDSLVSASASWKDPRKFSDLVDGLFRDALRARDFGIVEAMARRLGDKLDAESSARIAYSAARILELGLGAEEDANRTAPPAGAAARFAAIVGSTDAPVYYRALAAWRTGLEPQFVVLDNDAATKASERGAETLPGEEETLIGGMLDFGLFDMALSEAKERSKRLDDEALRRLASRFSSAGRPDLAIRLALVLSSGETYRPTCADYEFLFPRPYLDLVRGRQAEPGMTEALALGLIRSESLFKVEALSAAGAVGLTQLMPATAAAQAKALGFKDYDLKAPKDNIDIGLAHFGSLLRITGGRALRAMMAYNAGWGRYRANAAGTKGLPDDLLVETFGIGETRDYCRKILEATVMYNALYYGEKLSGIVGDIVKGD